MKSVVIDLRCDNCGCIFVVDDVDVCYKCPICDSSGVHVLKVDAAKREESA